MSINEMRLLRGSTVTLEFSGPGWLICKLDMTPYRVGRTSCYGSLMQVNCRHPLSRTAQQLWPRYPTTVLCRVTCNVESLMYIGNGGAPCIIR